MRPLLALLLCLAALPASAQTAPDHVFTPAPVPNTNPGTVAPADRAGRPDGAERSAPFSGLPNTLGPGAGQPTPSTLSDPSRDGGVTPDLSK